MQPLTEKYPFKKFWDAFMRQDRTCAHWDDRRTDQDVFIRRTLDKWFSGKYFQVVFDEYVPSQGLIEQTPAHRIKYTKYMAILGIRLTFAQYHEQITIIYVMPHSLKTERLDIKRNDWYNLSIIEDKESWTVLRRFYPTEKNEIKLPVLFESSLQTKKHTSKCTKQL